MSDPQDQNVDTSPSDVLVVGAGPTGLTLALELARFGVRPRIVDRGSDRAHESRALAIQPRTLEVLASSGVGAALAAAGNPAVGMRIHARGRSVEVPMYDLGFQDTPYPYLLFLSQAETERILEEHLAAMGISVERNVELVDLSSSGGVELATLEHADGSEEVASARYVVGCDGARSTVRRLAGISFQGGAYPQTFVLADTEADGVEEGAAHVFLTNLGMLFFFPLVTPATWRILVMRPPDDATPPDSPVSLNEVQSLVDRYSDTNIRLRDPVWMTNFRIHHRAAADYRTDRVFLAGDAAHVHSPAGAQGMNTGIQDAVNLGWKLVHTLGGRGDSALLETYELERKPIGQSVLAFTDRAFRVATSTNPIFGFARTRLAPTLIGLVLRLRTLRRYVFRTVSQLAIDYRGSPLSVDGQKIPGSRLRAGDRLPDATVIADGQTTSLHEVTAGPGWHLLLCGESKAWPEETTSRIANRHEDLVAVHHLDLAGGREILGSSHADATHFLIRPDGHIGYRSEGTDLETVERYLSRWVPGR